jgi:hypothetical protein
MTDLNRHFGDNVYDLNAILQPGTVFKHPQDVLADATLSRAEKRAILASWASDAAAVTSCPGLRAIPRANSIVLIDDILEALSAADATRRQAGQIEVERSVCSGSLIYSHQKRR